MTRTIWKSPIFTTEEVLMGGDPRIIHVGLDPNDGKPSVWIEHTVADDLLHRDLKPFIWLVRGTGQAIPGGFHHVGSVVEPPFVWHVYGLDR